MKQTMIATLAALMLAGALSAVSGATSSDSVSSAIMIGEGSAPAPIPSPSTTSGTSSTSLANSF